MKANTENAEKQAKAQFESICEMVKDFQSEDDEISDETRKEMLDNALSAEMRSGWVSSQEDMEPAEFKILLCWGGPAVRIIGELDNGEPSNARIEYQDWGIAWTEYYLDLEQEEILLTYCQQFYFGE